MHYTSIRIISVLLLLVFCISGCAQSKQAQEADVLSHLLDDFSNAIADGVPADMRMTVYNRTPYMGDLAPVRKADLIQTDKYVIEAAELSARIDQLNQAASATLKEPRKTRYKDLKVYYYVETGAEGIVLDVEISGKNRTIFVNGMEVEYDPAFYELVEPYMDTYTPAPVPETESWSTEGG